VCTPGPLIGLSSLPDLIFWLIPHFWVQRAATSVKSGPSEDQAMQMGGRGLVVELRLSNVKLDSEMG